MGRSRICGVCRGAHRTWFLDRVPHRSVPGRVLVSGATVVEFLTATSVAVATASPLLLVGSAPLPGVVRETLERLAPSEIVLCGMLPTLPPAMRAELGELMTPERP